MRIAIAALVVAMVPIALSAQRVTKRVYVRAVDAAGVPVLDLTRADLLVTEDGKPREVTRVALGTAPLRIVLMVDSSTSMGPMVNSFRAALQAFADAVPPEHEITFISTGGQIRVRTPPGTDRARLKTEIGLFASAGGANAFLDTLIEADRRFLKTAPTQWPVVVIVTTDRGENEREFDLDRYNRFMNDFVSRGGAAHAVIVRGKQVGPVTDLALNLVENVQGVSHSINTDTALAELLKGIAERITVDHLRMADHYEVEFSGDARSLTPIVNATVERDGVQVQMSARRPF
jgi:hypothetical protein